MEDTKITAQSRKKKGKSIMEKTLSQMIEELAEEYVAQYTRICKIEENVVREKIKTGIETAIVCQLEDLDAGDEIFNAFDESDYKEEYIADMAKVEEIESQMQRKAITKEERIALAAEYEALMNKWHSDED